MDVDDLRRTVQSSLEAGNFTLLYLWITFWGNGGAASRTKLDAFLRGRQALSNSDIHVLGYVNDELHNV